jgi:hypothetical protein
MLVTAVGGPFDGEPLDARVRRYWVRADPETGTPYLIGGDPAFGHACYNDVHSDPSVQPEQSVLGCYSLGPMGAWRVRYLDLQVPFDSADQRRYRILARFLTYAHMLLVGGDWLTWRPDRELAASVLLAFQEDGPTHLLAVRYLGYVLLDEINDA